MIRDDCARMTGKPDNVGSHCQFPVCRPTTRSEIPGRRRSQSSGGHSARRASIGLIRAARQAGTRQAAVEESSKVTMTKTNTVGSSGLVP